MLKILRDKRSFFCSYLASFSLHDQSTCNTIIFTFLKLTEGKKAVQSFYRNDSTGSALWTKVQECVCLVRDAQGKMKDEGNSTGRLLGFNYSPLQTNQKHRQCLTASISHQHFLYLLLSKPIKLRIKHICTNGEITISLRWSLVITQGHVEHASTTSTFCICRHTWPGKQNRAQSQRKPWHWHSCLGARDLQCAQCPSPCSFQPEGMARKRGRMLVWLFYEM